MYLQGTGHTAPSLKEPSAENQTKHGHDSFRDGQVESVNRCIYKGWVSPKCEEIYQEGTGHSKMSTDVSTRDGEVESVNRCIYKGWAFQNVNRCIFKGRGSRKSEQMYLQGMGQSAPSQLDTCVHILDCTQLFKSSF